MSSYYDDASLMLLASGGAQKDGKVYSVKPTDGSGDFTFTRGSNLSATRVNASQLIEKGRENVALHSNTFTSWNTISGSVTSGQAGYDGSNDAWLLTKTGDWSRVEQTISQTGVWTFSVYAKAGTSNWLALENGGVASDTCYFNLANGTKGSVGSGTIGSSIESVGNGWYRCSVTINDTSGIQRIYVATSNGNINGTNGNIYIQDAQLELGLVATDYIETGATTAQAGILENTPRFDYSGGASCPSLLLEPSRTNRFSNSEYSGGFTPGPAITATNNAAISPEGLQNAIKIEKTTNGYGYFRVGLPSLAGCLSVFAKKGNYRYIGLRNNQTNGVHSTFDFDTETFVYVASGQTCTFEDYGNGWYRLIAYQPNNESSIYQGIAMTDSGGNELLTSSTPNGSNFFIYGLQNEASVSYPTAYIPTYGVSQTRAQDVCNDAGDTATFNDSEGVLYAEFNPFFRAGSRQITINDGTYNNRIIIEVRENATKIKFLVNASGSNAFEATKNISVIDTIYKVAVKYSATDCAFFVNGEKVSSSTGTIVMPTGLEFLSFSGRNDTSLLFTSKTNQLIYFPTALSDLDCEILTGATTYNTFAAMALALNYTVYE